MPVDKHSSLITKDTNMHLKETLWINKSMYLRLAYPDAHMQPWRNGEKLRQWHSLNAVRDNKTVEVWYQRETGPWKKKKKKSV